MPAKHLIDTKRAGVTFVFLFILWLLFTFSLDPFSLLLGMVFSIVIAVTTYDLFVESDEKIHKGMIPRFEYFFVYIFVVLREIYAASMQVVIQVLTMEINPGTVSIKTRLGSKFARALLAHSITLTPGTVVIDLQDDEFLVHWLSIRTADPGKAAELIKGNYEEKLERIFY